MTRFWAVTLVMSDCEVVVSDRSHFMYIMSSLTVYEIANALPAASDRLRACRLGEVMQLPFAKLP
jgi:hypothetical protein